MKYSVEEITELIENNEVTSEIIDWKDPFDILYEEEADVEIGGLTLKFEDCGGGEGDGARKWVVFKIGEQYFEMNGYYSSWDDGEWDTDLVEVKPVQVMRTEYKEV